MSAFEEECESQRKDKWQQEIQSEKSLQNEMGHQHQLLKRECHALTYDFKKIYFLAAVLKRDSIVNGQVQKQGDQLRSYSNVQARADDVNRRDGEKWCGS